MKINKCPKCLQNGGYLTFRSGRPSSKKYPYIGHSDPSRKSKVKWCYLSQANFDKLKLPNTRITSRKYVFNDLDNETLRRREMIMELYEKYIRLFQIIKNKLGKHHLASKLDPQELNEVSIAFGDAMTYWKTRLQESKSVSDDQLMRVLVVIGAYVDWISSQYSLHIKNKTPLSAKQVRKIVTGRVKEIHPLYDPQNRKEALQRRFTGINCIHCKSWRVDEKYVSMKFKTLHCYACGKNWNLNPKSKTFV